MKKILITFFVICAACAVASQSLSAATGKSLDGKIGTAYATDAEKFGWQLNFAFLTELDPYFAIGFEPGIYWIKWERKIGTTQQGTLNADVKADTNAYMIPLIGVAQIRLPNLRNKMYVQPYCNIGIGYSFMILNYTQPEYVAASGATVPSESKTKFYHGLTEQLMFGASFQPPESKIEFLFELGYRWAKLQKGDIEIDMSGFVFNLGVKYPFGTN